MGIDPISMAVIGGVGVGMQALGSEESGQAAQTAANYQAAVAANNAKTAQQNASWDIEAGDIAATNKGLQTRAVIGSQKANQGAGGIDVNTGSAVDVRAGTDELGMLDALTTRSDAAKRAYGAEVEGVSDTAQSQLDIMQGEQAKESGDINAISGLINGASTVGGNYLKFQQKFG